MSFYEGKLYSLGTTCSLLGVPLDFIFEEALTSSISIFMKALPLHKSRALPVKLEAIEQLFLETKDPKGAFTLIQPQDLFAISPDLFTKLKMAKEGIRLDHFRIPVLFYLTLPDIRELKVIKKQIDRPASSKDSPVAARHKDIALAALSLINDDFESILSNQCRYSTSVKGNRRIKLKSLVGEFGRRNALAKLKASQTPLSISHKTIERVLKAAIFPNKNADQ